MVEARVAGRIEKSAAERDVPRLASAVATPFFSLLLAQKSQRCERVAT